MQLLPIVALLDHTTGSVEWMDITKRPLVGQNGGLWLAKMAAGLPKLQFLPCWAMSLAVWSGWRAPPGSWLLAKIAMVALLDHAIGTLVGGLY